MTTSNADQAAIAATIIDMERAALERWGKGDPFGFIEVIRKLESGATIALLLDRPPPSTAVPVELFGRPFAASMAAAELARASGCALIPVYIPRGEKNYSARVLPAIAYDRAALRDRAVRAELTQQIVRLFEPAIREHLDQWYHFVPVWSREPGGEGGRDSDLE